MKLTRALALTVVVTVALLTAACGSSSASTGATVQTWGAVGDSITMGWGSSDQATKAYYVLAGVPAAANPGQCLIADGCAGTPLDQTFATELSWLRDTRGVTSVVVEIGVNDLGRVSDEQLEAAYAHLLSTGAAYGFRVVLSTITPGGPSRFSAVQESQREQVNGWLREQGQVVDYAVALGGNVLAPAFDSGDGLHPSDAGHAAMAAALDVFIASQAPPPVAAPVVKKPHHPRWWCRHHAHRWWCAR